VRILLSLACFALLAGCSACDREPTSDPGAQPEPTSAGTAVIEGIVKLAPGAELPMYAENPLAPGTGRPPLPESCPAPNDSDRRPVRRVRGDRLHGAVVYLGDMSSAPEHEPEVHTVFIRECRLGPRFVAATRGDRMRIVNETDYPFLPDTGTGMMQALLYRQEREYELTQGGIRTLQCGFAAPCGRTEVITMYHSLHDVTDGEGSFRIEDVPANDELHVVAWHPLFQHVDQQLTLEPGETRRLEIVLQPAPPPQPGQPDTANQPDILF
jgi:hypothetical protein